MLHLFKISVLSLLLYLGLSGCEKKDDGKIKITFRLNKAKGAGAVLVTYNMLSLDTLLLGKSTLDSNGFGIIETRIEKPVFGHVNLQDTYIPLYLKAGDEIVLEADASKIGGGIKVTGDGFVISRFLRNIQKVTQNYYNHNAKAIWQIEPAEFASIFKLYQNELYKEAERLEKEEGIAPEELDLMKKKVEMVLYEYQQHYVNNHYSYDLDDPTIPADLKKVATTLPVDSVFFDKNSYDYGQILSSYLISGIHGPLGKLTDKMNQDSLDGHWLEVSDDFIQKMTLSPFLKRHFRAANINYWLRMDGLSPEIAKLREDFYKTPVSPVYRKTLDQSFAKWEPLAPGKPAPNFTGTTADGKPISLSSLKGKLVYVDVWATWCGPCRDEFPHSKKLVKEFEGNDKIAFLYVSTDSNIDTWKKLLPDKSVPAGIHLHQKQDGQPDAIWEKYHLWGIPRYILIDAEGKMLKTHAPRPSSDDILPLLKGYLKES
ncbi:TlpA disulfide reductase family protein [Dyadobacter sp. CY343]|uniref:TlpA family protein disulfide reductase n=1 Tax=Dyadobacter sp. CY343 TaxID=2907299 RepID=UPI001F26B163|nr:TlpA disulfide reductase family protein [Dyadobacter sp. CY343]MCE7060859.1 TlpA family protein disulfide reductase [Dyadobacter sp. CY343]